MKEFQNQNGVTLIRRLLGRKRRHKSKTKSTKHKTRKSLTRALRSTYDNANVNNNILNLSQIKLSQSQISLLGRGLTFVKTPRRVPLNEVLTAFSAFERRMHIQYHFRDHNSEKPTFYKKSNWDPPVPECTPIHDYLSCVQNDIRNLYTHPKQNPQNLTKNELEALNELKNNQNIVIKRADKGGKIVIWPREMYMSEASKQLSDTKYYHKLDKDQTGELALNIESFLTTIESKRLLSESTIEYLRPESPTRTPVFYLLPKIHKEGIPGRPIISGCGSPNEKISRFLDHYLQPIVQTLPSYIKDTNDFLTKILYSNLIVPRNSTLVSFDVKSLYTNIPQEEGIQSNIEQMHQYYGENLPLPISIITQMFNFVLKNNYFTFNNEFYLQIHGTAMGTPCSPNYANLFMAKLEKTILNNNNFTKQPLLWLRFIDDIFMIWQHNERELEEFYKYINNIHPTIKFEITSSKNNINFLDTNEIGQLESTIYKKPTDTCALLHRQSFHPEHTKTSVIFSQALRYRRVITKDDNLIQNLQKLRYQLLQRGYKFSEINSQFNKVLHYSQKQLLINKKQQQQHSNILPFVVPFDKTTQSISSILKRHWHFINNEPRLKELWPATPILSLKKHPSLGDILVRADLPKTKQ